MKEIRYAIFDLDGTLIDSRKGIIEGLKNACAECGYFISDDTKIPVGPPLYDTIKSACPNVDEKTVYKITEIFRNNCQEYDICVSAPFKGTDNIINYLHTNGVKIYVATYKPKIYSGAIVKKYFNDMILDVVTPTELPSWIDYVHNNCTKTDIVEFLIKKHNIDCTKCFMAGDAQSDIDAANTFNILSIAAKYGYCTSIENAKYCADNPEELFNIIKDLSKTEVAG